MLCLAKWSYRVDSQGRGEQLLTLPSSPAETKDFAMLYDTTMIWGVCMGLGTPRQSRRSMGRPRWCKRLTTFGKTNQDEGSAALGQSSERSWDSHPWGMLKSSAQSHEQLGSMLNLAFPWSKLWPEPSRCSFQPLCFWDIMMLQCFFPSTGHRWITADAGGPPPMVFGLQTGLGSHQNSSPHPAQTPSSGNH